MARGVRGPSAFSKTVARQIRGSLGRFLAILGIVALGCGFYAGLQMCGPDMRAAADALYDGTNLYDLRLVSTLGFSEKDVDRVAAVEGVQDVMAAISCDVMASMGDERLAVRMSSLDVEAAEQGEESGAAAILSSDGSYLNRVFLREGRWPQAPDECVITADKAVGGVSVGDSVEALYGTTDLDDLLRVRTFRVVGSVSSSNYPYTGSFGSTTLGSGMIGSYVYVAPGAFVDDAPFTEMYARVAGASQFESGSDAYREAVAVVAGRIESAEGSLAASRLDDVRAEAQERVDDGRAEYEEERDKAHDELADARRELEDAKRELDDGARELADGRAQYEDGVRELADKRQEAEEQLDDAQRTIDAGAQKLAASARELEAGKQKLAAGKREYASGKDELLKKLGARTLREAKAALGDQRAQAERGKEALEQARAGAQGIQDGRAQLQTQEQELAAARTSWEEGRDQLLAGLAAQGMPASTVEEAQAQLGQAIAQMEAAGAPEESIAPLRQALAQADELAAAGTRIEEGEAAVVQARQQLDDGERDLLSGLAAQGMDATDVASALAVIDGAIGEADAGLARIDEGLDGIAKLESAKETLDKSARELDDGARELARGREELDAGQRELDAQRADAERQLAEGQDELDDARRKLDDAEAELASGTRQYQDGLAEYADGEREAREKLDDAKRQLDDAQREVDELELPDIYLLDRAKSEGAETYDADSHRIDAIADVFPLMFFLVAALVALTTMTRMVEDDRIEIGTYKALGYSTARIASKYLVYAGAAAGVGALVGILALSQVLPYIVTSSYAIIYTVPLHPFPLPVDLGISLTAGGLGVGVTLLATWAAVVASLREAPATLMLPRAPASGKRILLERVGPLWRRLSFSWKVTCRNLFRYKRRLTMTVIGISGCTALLLVGFGLHDSIWDIIDCQYGPIVHYNTTIGLDDDANEFDVRGVIASLEQSGDVWGIERVQQVNMQAGTADEAPMRVQVVVPREADRLEHAITLRNRLSQAPIPFGDDAVVVTEKISIKYGIEPGDQIVLFEQDAIGNAKGEGHALRVDGVAENYVGNLVYVGRAAWARVDDKEPVFSTLLCSANDDAATRERLARELQGREDVSTVVFSNETISMYRNMLSVVDLVVVVLIVSAGLLAFIVLYNLTNINIGERVREIASLKVLGFTKSEVYAYIFREILLLSLLGDVLGLWLGTQLASFVITTAEVDYVMFGRTIHPPSYGYAFVLTVVFAVLIMLLMRKKLDHVDMVESLKSVD